MVLTNSLVLAWAALVVLGASTSAQTQRNKLFRRASAPRQVSLDLATGTYTRGPVVHDRGSTTVTDLTNIDILDGSGLGWVATDTGGGSCTWFQMASKGMGVNQGVGGGAHQHPAPPGSDLMSAIQFFYCSGALDANSGGAGGNVELGFYEGYTIFGGAPTTTATVVNLTGLPGNTAPGGFLGGARCYGLQVNFDAPVVFKDDVFVGYSWHYQDVGTDGVYGATFPFLACVVSCSGTSLLNGSAGGAGTATGRNEDGQGMLDAFDAFCTGAFPNGPTANTYTFATSGPFAPPFAPTTRSSIGMRIMEHGQPWSAISVFQVDYAFENLDWDFSDTGRLEVDLVKLKEVLPYGFLNVATPDGWVVQNLPIPLECPYDVMATYFGIGPLAFDHQQLFSRDVAICYTTEVLSQFAPTVFSPIGVSRCKYNAEGLGTGSTTAKPEPPLPGDLQYPAGCVSKSAVMQTPAHRNVQTAQNQCSPMAVANSLQWLEDKYGLKLEPDHVLGLRTDNPNVTLVGVLEEKMNRAVTNRETGEPTALLQRNLGIHRFIADARAKKQLVFGWALQPPMGAGQLQQWYVSKVMSGAAAFIGMAWGEDAAHEVALVGTGVVGKPDDNASDQRWIAFVHDELQTDEDQNPDDTRGTTKDGKVIVTATWVKRVGAVDVLTQMPGRPEVYSAGAITSLGKKQKP